MLNSKKFRWLLIAICVSILSGCAKENTFNPHLKNKQNALAYLDAKSANNPLFTKKQERKAYNRFINHYYSPWTGHNLIFAYAKIKLFTTAEIADLAKKPGWNENKHRYTEKWVNAIHSNMLLNEFPNHQQRAIVVNSSDERTLPTNKPAYSSVTKPGWFYPFDNLQGSNLPAGLPVKILQMSNNKAWDLILTNGSFGWVKANNLAMVNQSFIHAWRKNKGYIEVNNDDVPILDNSHVFRFMAHMGSIYPIAAVSKNNYRIKIAVKNINGNAIIRTALINKEDAIKIPMLTTPENIATVANQFIGMPYGWGGIYGYRDCSSTTRAIFSYFGIWLPRNSTAQAELSGKVIDLNKMSNKQKIKTIEKDGIPFFTLVHINGHVMIYVGKKNHILYVLHDMWGLGTYRLFKSEGRAVVGRTVITPIDFGKHYLNVEHSLLDKVVGITLLNQPPSKEQIG